MTDHVLLTPMGATEIASHEGLVREAYLDSVGVWTWSIGVTNNSGHQVYPRYKDAPATLDKCLDVYLWLLETSYAPAVRQAFTVDLTEEQFHAALSFHYNTGAIATATWVKDVNAGNMADGEHNIMNWRSPAEIIERREKERDLFFHNVWSNNGHCTEYPVLKPSYTPDWGNAMSMEILSTFENLIGD